MHNKNNNFKDRRYIIPSIKENEWLAKINSLRNLIVLFYHIENNSLEL